MLPTALAETPQQHLVYTQPLAEDDDFCLRRKRTKPARRRDGNHWLKMTTFGRYVALHIMQSVFSVADAAGGG